MTNRRRLVIGASAGGLLVIAAAVYIAGYLMTSDRTPANASVNGIAIGSMTPDQAITTLKAGLAPTVESPITLTGNETSATINPAEAGLQIDYAATVAASGSGRSWKPSHIWMVLRGGGPVDPVVVTDSTKLTTAVKGVAPEFSTEKADATVSWSGTKPTVKKGVPAAALNVDQTVTAVLDAWPSSNKVNAAVDATEPDITTAEAEAAAKQASAAVASPVTVKIGDSSVQITPEQIATATTFPVKNGTISATTDGNVLYEVTKPAIDKLGLAEGKDAKVTLVNGKPSITPSSDGLGVSREDFVKVVQPALAATGAARTVAAPVTKQPAKFSTEDAKKLAINEVVGEFTTNFPYAEYRNVNLSRAAGSINNTMLKPDEIFSLNKTLGERTVANGYVDGYVIQGGVLRRETGGGVSQSATTTYNAIFFAGLQDIEHHPHTLYFSRYPAGREATVYWGSLDLRFKNNTPYGVLMQAYVKKASPGGQGSITVRVWSTKVYDRVESSELVKSNYTNGRDIVSDDPQCEPQAPSPGFDVNYSRLFYKNGQLVKTEKFFWRYSPADRVTCSR